MLWMTVGGTAIGSGPVVGSACPPYIDRIRSFTEIVIVRRAAMPGRIIQGEISTHRHDAQ